MTSKKQQETAERYTAPALDKGLDIIELLAGSPEPMTQIEIARGLGRAPNEIYRMLNVLLKRRFVVTTWDGDRYRLSLKMLSLANAYPPMQRMREIAEPIMRRASWAVKQSCHLAVWDDGDVVVEMPVVTPGTFRWSLRAGSRLGLYNSGSGKTITAFQSRKRQLFMIESHDLIEGETATETESFLAELDRIRAKGFLREKSVTLDGVRNLCFPILDSDGIAACVLTCPYIRRIDASTPPDLDAVFETFRSAAGEISRELHG